MKHVLTTCILILIILSGYSTVVSGQSPTEEESAVNLSTEIEGISGNTKEKADKLYDLGFYVINTDVDSAGRIFERVREISEAIDYQEGLVNYYSGITNVYNYKGDFEKGLEYNKNGLEVARQLEDRTYLARQLANTGISYSYIGDFESGIDYARQALEVFRELGDEAREARMLFTIGVFYNNLSKAIALDSAIVNQATEYFEKTLPLAVELKDTLLHIEVLSNLGLTLNNATKYQDARQYLDEAETLALGFGMPSLLETIYRSKSVNAREMGNYDEAITYARRALDISQDWGAPLYEVLTKKELALAYSKSGRSAEALRVLEEILPLAEEEEMVLVLDGLYMNYSENLAELGQYKQAYEYHLKGSEIADSVRGADIKTQLLVLEEKYQSARKDAQILGLEVSKERQKWWITGLVLGLLLTGLLAYFIAKRYQYRARIAEQERLRLQKEQKLKASESIIQGQEEERQRIARDLHDGLGGLLSGLKLTLNTMDGNVILSESSVDTFHKALGQLDLAISEMRKVAHNMMPEALINFGLDDTLSDFASSLSENTPLTVHYQSYGYRSMSQQTEITLYRIVQEAVNNVLKHADADDVFIQLDQDKDHVTLTIEDNGRGFEVDKPSAGIGLKNIQNRVAYLNGEIDISSTPGQGTILVIQIKPTVDGED